MSAACWFCFGLLGMLVALWLGYCAWRWWRLAYGSTWGDDQ